MIRSRQRAFARLYALLGLTTALVLTLFTACSKSDKTGTGPSGTSIAIALAPASLSLVQGANATVALAISRSNFTDAVTLASSGAPTGVTVAFSATSTTGTSVTVTVTAAATVASGTYPIVITASGAGITNATATLTLAVTGTAVTFTYCRTTPIWFAVQEGTGAWRQILPTSAGVFSFNFAGPSGGVAAVTQGTSNADSYGLSVTYATVDQLKEIGQALCDYSGAKTVTANVVKAASDRIDVGFGQFYQFGGTTKTNYVFPAVPNGPIDLVASRNGTAGAAANRVIIRRGIDVPTGTILPNLDFTTTTEGFVPDTRTLTVTGAQGVDFFSVTGFYDPNIITGIGSPIGVSTQLTPTTFTFPVLPASQIIVGDLHDVAAQVQAGDGFSGYSTETLMHTPHDVALTLPAPPAAATVNIATTTPFVRPHIAIARQPDYGSDLTVFMSQSVTGTFSRQFLLEFTGAYFGTAATDYTLPDFSGVAGFNNTWALKTGTAASWQLNASGRTMAPNAAVFKNYALDGNVFRFGFRNGSITP